MHCLRGCSLFAAAAIRVCAHPSRASKAGRPLRAVRHHHLSKAKRPSFPKEIIVSPHRQKGSGHGRGPQGVSDDAAAVAQVPLACKLNYVAPGRDAGPWRRQRACPCIWIIASYMGGA